MQYFQEEEAEQVGNGARPAQARPLSLPATD
jgi:hypothetical protein